MQRPGATRRGLGRDVPRFVAAAAASLILAGAIATPATAVDPPSPPDPAPPLAALDPQDWQDQQNMTWDDYRPIPNTDWANPAGVPSVRGLRILLVAVDFNDQPFVITQSKQSDLFGNPQRDPIARPDVPKFYRDYYMVPSEVNHGHTIHEYWMEQTRGRYGVTQMDFAGPYRMPKFLYQYSLNEFNQNATGSNACPAQTNKVGAQTSATNLVVASSAFFYVGDIITIAGVSGTRTVTAIPDATHITISQATTVSNNAFIHDCTFNMDTDVNTAFRADLGCSGNCGYDVVLRIYAGYDETSVWQEFGEMMFETKEDVPDAWGNPNPALPNWAITRYVEWTSWKAAAQQWGLSSIRQGESSGTITHEMGHFFFSIGDNNNNPFATPYHRVGSAPWDMMDRGSFNGPGGHHMRWVVPPDMGAWMPAGLMLRNKIHMNVLPETNILRLNRNALATSGLAVTEVTARAVDPGVSGSSGIRIALDGSSPIDKTPSCSTNTDPFCRGNTGWNHYAVEVIQRIGYDSFTPDNGVLISINKTSEGSTCGYNCFNWVIDAHPEDMNMVDYYKPVSGSPVMRTIGDHRQLNDALFHAGTNSGSQYEWEDTPNRLHFYVVDVKHDADGVLSYTVAVKSLDGNGSQTRGADVAAAPAQDLVGTWAFCQFPLTNTGSGAPVSGSIHGDVNDISAAFNNDVYRLSASATGAGWSAQLSNALAAVPFGGTVSVPVYVTRSNGSASSGEISLTATSVSNATATSTATCAVSVVPPTVTYTLDPASPSGDNGWYAGDVDLAWQVSDADAIVDGCTDESFVTDGVFDRSCSAISDGGTTSVDVTVRRDATDPEVAVTGVTDGAVYVLGTEPTPGCATTDNLSGVDTSASPLVTGGPTVGFFAVACLGARDVAGNTATASASYQVIYDFAGFRAPLANPPAVNTANAGSGRPAKFSLTGFQGLGVLSGSGPTWTPIDCGTGTPTGPASAAIAAEPFSYDALLDEYVFVWKTNKASANRCARLDVGLMDGTTHSALFHFVK